MTDPSFSNRLNSSSQSDLHQKATGAVGLKQSMVLVKGSNPGLSFTNRSAHNLGPRKSIMSQSCIRKDSLDIESFMREVKEKLSFVTRTLSEHEREINDFKQKSINTSFFSSSDSFFRNESLNNELVRSVRKQFEEDSYKLRNNIYAEIDALKAELRNDCVKKGEIEYMFGKFQNNVSDLIHNSSLNKEINELKSKLRNQTQSLHSFFAQELSIKLKQINDATSKNLLEVTHYIDKIKSKIQNVRQQLKPSFLASNQKCYSPKLIKYKEVMQKLPSSSYEKIGEECIVGETIYYVDKDCYLLDSTFYYLLDKNGKQIQLDPKQVSLLNSFGLLR